MTRKTSGTVDLKSRIALVASNEIDYGIARVWASCVNAFVFGAATIHS